MRTSIWDVFTWCFCQYLIKPYSKRTQVSDPEIKAPQIPPPPQKKPNNKKQKKVKNKEETKVDPTSHVDPSLAASLAPFSNC